MEKKKLFKLTGSIALAAALLLGATACSSNNDSSSQSSQSSQSSHSSSSSSETASSSSSSQEAVSESTIKTDTGKIKISQAEALKKFDSQFKNKKIKSIDLKLEGNQYVYEIDAVDSTKEYSAEINAETGQISHAHSETLDLDDRHEKTLDLNNVISREEATKIAEKHANGTSQEWNLEQDGNTAYWDIKVSNGSHLTEVKINAQTKQVVHSEHDDDDD